MEWIKVEDRLPKDDRRLLVSFDDGEIRIGSYWGNKKDEIASEIKELITEVFEVPDKIIVK